MPSEMEQLVIFTLDNEYYGADIADINTIIRLPEITRIPNTPDYVLGIMNLRGTVVPIIDSRLKLGLQPVDATKATRVIVVEDTGQQISFVVDGVTETIQMEKVNIEQVKKIATTGADNDFILGIR